MDRCSGMRLWVEGQNESETSDNILKIAKLEIVGNEWEELGEINIDSSTLRNCY